MALFFQNNVGLDAANTYRDFSEPRWSNVPCVSVENRFPERFLRNKSMFMIWTHTQTNDMWKKTKLLFNKPLCLKVTRYYYDTVISSQDYKNNNQVSIA